MAKKYFTDESLATLVEETKLYVDGAVDTLSAQVAYINLEDNEDVADTGNVSNIVVDSVLSETSTNPIQNKTVAAELSNLSKEIVQSDWNQNDETASDYVKNRPFYTSDPVETTVLEETTIESDSFSDWDGVYGVEIALSEPLQNKTDYTVIFDGVTYELMSVLDYGIPSIGSCYDELANNTTYPFEVYTNSDGTSWLAVKENASHTISIVEHIQKIHQIDEKYLPISDADKLFNASKILDFDYMINSITGRIRLNDIFDGDIFDIPKATWDRVIYILSNNRRNCVVTNNAEVIFLEIVGYESDFLDVRYTTPLSFDISDGKYICKWIRNQYEFVYDVDAQQVSVSVSKATYKSEPIITKVN